MSVLKLSEQVLLTDHLCYVGNPISRFMHLNFLNYGHIAVRYTTKVRLSIIVERVRLVRLVVC